MNISILVVDDSKYKQKLLADELEKLRVTKECIHFCDNAASARKILDQKRFDLMLLDLNLPARQASIDTPSAEVGVELLRQIVEDRDLPAPDNIVGITSDADSMKEYADDFHMLTTQILFVEPGSIEWRQSLALIIGRLRNSNTNAYDVDICILTALREPELSEILKFPYGWGAEESLGNGVLIRKGVIEIDGVARKIVAAHATQMGPVSATFVTQLLINQYRPQLVLMTGICGGVGDRPKLGDLIVAERSWDWQSGKWQHDGKFESAPDAKEATAELVGLARGVKDDLAQFHQAYTGYRPPGIPQILPGPLVSGSAVVASEKMHEIFIDQHRKSIGVDMECYGVYFAANMCVEKKPKVLCVKGVSDLANRAKDDDFQEYCSYLSGMVAFKIAEKYFKSLKSQ